MDETTSVIEAPLPTPVSPEPIVPAPPISSRFLFVDVAALRAKQLRRGALARLERPVTEEPDVAASVLSPMTAGFRMDSPHKPERVAMEEVRRCLVSYTITSAQAEEHV